MRNLILPCLTVATLFLGSSPAVLAQATPGKEHEELKALEGVWDATVKMEGSESKAVAEYKMTCGGLWLETNFEADFGGQKFQGKGMDGYDATKKQYVTIWVDSMSDSPMIMHGKKEGKVTTLTGEGPGPTGIRKYKSVTTQDSADKMTFQMFTVDDGKENEMMTIVYSRRKK